MSSVISLLIPSFIAGVLTFLAPCTLPLLPAYLSFISGSSARDVSHPERSLKLRRHALQNGIFYVIGFTFVFVVLGVIFGLGGSFFAVYRPILTKIGGVCIAFFGLFLLGIFDRIEWLKCLMSSEHRFHIAHVLTPGRPMSSLIFGATFALGWTPCIGPILGSVLFLASTTGTAWQGAILLFVFSLGLAIPFLIVAYGIGHATHVVKKLTRVLPYISMIGGLLLILLGVLLFTDSASVWMSWSYTFFEFCHFDWILDYL